MVDLWGDTYRYSRGGNLLEDLEARPLEDTAHLAEDTVRRGQSPSLYATYPSL